MKPDAQALLWDVERAAGAIAGFIEGLDTRRYAASDVVRSAVERKFEIIGEALGWLAKIDPKLVERIPRYRETIAFRNLFIHGYAAESAPPLREAVAALLKEPNDESSSSSFL